MKKWLLVFLAITLYACSKQDDSLIDRELIVGQFLNDWEFSFFLEEPNQNAFKLWIPEGVSPRAILVLSTGGANDGRFLADDVKWQAYANKEKLAIMGVFVRSGTELASYNLLLALDKICAKNNLPEVSKLPLLLRGFSHGGVFSYRFSELYPDRTLAYSNIKGSLTPISKKLPPGLLIVGGQDVASRNATIKNAFLTQRALGGIVCYAVDQNAFHSVNDETDDVVRAFFTAVLKKRLLNNSIAEIDESTIFLGNTTTLQSYSYSTYPDDKSVASCIIDQDFNTFWLNFVK